MRFRTSLIFALLLLAPPSFAQNDTDEDFFKDRPGESPEANIAPKPTSSPIPSPTPAGRAVIDAEVTPVSPDAKPEPLKKEHNETLTDSHPLFDWSKHKNETLVPHPLSDQGLIEITRDRTYIYTVKPTEHHHTGTLLVGYFNPTNLRNPDDPADTFASNYGGGGNSIFLMNYEWRLFDMGIGRVGVTAGTGLFFAQGHGHFAHPELEPPNLKPLETFSLAVVPIEGGVVYHVQFWDKQLFVPYGAGGLTLIPFAELRDDGKGPKFGGSAAVYVSAGGGLNMTYFDRFAALTLDREYGIGKVYLLAEVREYVNLSPHYDFGGLVPALGFNAEF